MKSSKRILFSAAILVLGLLVVGARTQPSPPAQPKASAAFSPGDYTGTFQLDIREMANSSTTSPQLSVNFMDNHDIDISGYIDVHMTGPTTGTVLVVPTRYIIYAIRDVSGEGSGVKCKMTGYLNGDATIIFLSHLLNNYDPQTQSFKSDLIISEWSRQDFQNIAVSNVPACSQQVNEEQMTRQMQNFFDNINKYGTTHFYVKDSGKSALYGTVELADYAKLVKMPGGQLERTTSGHWSVYKEPSKPKGWNK
jgi:hypothetical protein